MKIGKAIAEIPPEGTTRGKYAAVWQAASILKAGQWLPVECDSELDARRLQAATGSSRMKNRYACRVRGKVAYLALPKGAE